MAQVLHVDRLSNEVLPSFSVAPGESLVDAIGRLGGTCRLKHVPDEEVPPRKLATDVAEFIAGYSPEEVDSVLAVYRRYGWLDAEEFDTVGQAEGYLDYGEEEGRFAGEAIVDAAGLVAVWS